MPRPGSLPCRKDKNHDAIVSVFRMLGCSVSSTHEVGNGFVDICVGVGGSEKGLGFAGDGWVLLVEIKDGSKPPSARKLTLPEEIWHATWRGHRCIIKSPEEAIALVAFVKQKIIKAKELGLWPLTPPSQ